MQHHVAPSNSVWDYLHGMTCGQLIAKKSNKTVYTIAGDSTVAEAMKLMNEHQIVSLPVTTKVGESEQVVGVVDILDILSLLNRLAPKRTQMDAGSLFDYGKRISDAPMIKVLNLSGRNPFAPVMAEDTVSMAVQFFASGVHQVPVLDQQGNICGILSQSDVIRDLHSQFTKDALDDTSKLPLNKLWLGVQGGVACITHTATVFQALREMRRFEVSALAVLDPQGKLCGNLSARDFRGLFSESLPSLSKPVIEFAPSAGASVICVKRDASIKQVVAELATNAIHRVWVIDDDFKPVGVVSITDLMNCFATHDKWLELNWDQDSD